MPTGRPTPPPKGTGKFAIIAAVVVGLMIVTTFVGMNLQHAQTLHEQQSGQVKPSETPLHEKDLQRTPVK
jgi:hypothetical protein